MSNVVNTNGLNLSLLGYSSKRDYFGGDAVVFRQVDTYSYEYIPADLGQIAGTGLSPNISALISGQIAAFSGDVTIRTMEIPNSYDNLEEQIRTAKYRITVEVRNSIGSGDTSAYLGLNAVTQTGYAGLNGFSENFQFENSEESQKFHHSINFELRTGDRSFAQTIASGILKNEPSFGTGVLTGYLQTYSDVNSTNYYTETYDSFKNTYSFQKTKTLYKLTGLGYTFDVDTHFDYNDGISTVTDGIKVRGLATFTQAQDGLTTLIGQSASRAQTVYSAYANFGGIASAGTLFTSPLKTVSKFNPQALAAEASLTFTDNPLYAGNYKQEQALTLARDVNEITRVTNNFNFTLLKNITGDMDSAYTSYFNGLATTVIASGEAAAYYNSYGYPRTLALVDVSAKSPRRKRTFSISYEFSDDPRYSVTVNGIFFPNLDTKVSDNSPKDGITEYKVINKPQTLVNYSYQQTPGVKTATLTAIRSRPASNQLTSFSVPSGEVAALYLQSLNLLTKTFTNLHGLNYYLSNLSLNITNENKLEMTTTINYTRKKYG